MSITKEDIMGYFKDNSVDEDILDAVRKECERARNNYIDYMCSLPYDKNLD